MTSQKLANQIELSLFAALIFISVELLRIPVGPQFIHLGNALVVIAVLLYGSKKGALVATIGLGIFDVMNGYAAVAWITILESLIICYLLHLFYEKWLQSNDKTSNIISVGIIAAVAKLLINLIKYTFIGYLGGNLPVQIALATAIGKIGGSFGSSLATAIAVPVLYPIFKQLKRRRSFK